jgi:hypothetical protein
MSSGVKELPLSRTLRGVPWLAERRFCATVPALETEEARSLARRVRCRLEGTCATDRTDSDEFDWVSYRFEGLLLRLLFQAHSSARDHLVVNMVVIGGGFATSGIAVASGSGEQGTLVSWVVFALGLLVALAGGVSQLFRPGQRATNCEALVTQLQDEGWALWSRRGDYKALDAEGLFAAFEERVATIRRRAATLTVLTDSEGQGDQVNDPE